MCNIFETEQDTYTDCSGEVGGECMCNIFETEQDTYPDSSGEVRGKCTMYICVIYLKLNKIHPGGRGGRRRGV